MTNLKRFKPVFILFIFILLLGNRCKKEELKWRPDFYVGSPSDGSIINEENKQIQCVDPEFENYGCLHIDKINELRRILRKHCD